MMFYGKIGIKSTQRIHDEFKCKLRHVLWTDRRFFRQPGLDQADAAGETEGVVVCQVVHLLRKCLLQCVQAVLGEERFDPVQEGDVAVGPEQGGADVPVFRKDGENILNEGEAVFIEGTYRMRMDQILNLPVSSFSIFSIMS